MAFLQRVHGVTHCDKVHSCDNHKDLNLKPLFKSRDPRSVGYCTKEASNTQVSWLRSQKFWCVTENRQLLSLSSVDPVVSTNAGHHLDSRNFPHTLGYIYHKYQVCNLPYNWLHAHAPFLALLIENFQVVASLDF